MNILQCQFCQALKTNRKGLSYHISMKHKTKFIDYITQFEHGGMRPTCKCGCGKAVRFFGGKFMDWFGHHFFAGRPKSPEQKIKISKFHKGRKLPEEHKKKIAKGVRHRLDTDPDIRQRMSAATKGRKRTLEQRKKMSVSRLAGFASGKIVINREKISETMANMYVNDGFKWSKGKHESPKTGKTHWYRSSWEKTFMELLDADDRVVSWLSEWTKIPYTLDGKRRLYVPDFLVTNDSGQKFLIEVKPYELRDRPMNLAKKDVASDLCTQNQWMYKQWDARDDYQEVLS